jgi:predicted MFS family arabinose efflux permease
MVEGLTGFGACSLLCALAPSSPALIVFRGMQGIAGALLVPASLALIMDHYEARREQAAAIGTWTAWTGMAAVIGPFGGGALIQIASWRWIFAINVVPVVMTVWLLSRVPESPRTGCRIDWPGGVLAVLGLAGPVFALIEAPRLGWSSAAVTGPLVIGLVLLMALLWWEGRAPEPMMPLNLFAARNFAVGNLTTFALYAGLNVATFFIVLFIQQVAGYTPVKAGLALLPITVLMFTLSRRWGALTARLGPRPFMGLGPIVCATGLLLESRMGARAPYLTGVLPGLVVFGLGLSATVAPLTATVLGAVHPGHAGVASGVNNALARVAGLIAIAAIGAVIAASFGARLSARIDHRVPPATLATARARPLVTRASYAPPAMRRELHTALVSASVGAYRFGLEIAAALAAVGGLLSLLGLASGAEPEQAGEAQRGERVAAELQPLGGEQHGPFHGSGDHSRDVAGADRDMGRGIRGGPPLHRALPGRDPDRVAAVDVGQAQLEGRVELPRGLGIEAPDEPSRDGRGDGAP